MSQGVAEAIEALDGIVDRMGIDVEVERVDGDEGVVLALRGEGEAELSEGGVLDALQHLVNRMARNAVEGEDPGLPVSVDAGGWRARRTDQLKELAADWAQEARETGRPVTADMLSPYERRLVHMAMEGEEGVTTRSVGEGRERRLRIFPD